MVSPDENPAILRKAGTMQTESTEQLPALSEDPAKVCGGIVLEERGAVNHGIDRAEFIHHPWQQRAYSRFIFKICIKMATGAR